MDECPYPPDIGICDMDEWGRIAKAAATHDDVWLVEEMRLRGFDAVDSGDGRYHIPWIRRDGALDWIICAAETLPEALFTVRGKS